MKCHETDSDRTAEVIVKANNKRCLEYHDSVDEDGALCCYVALDPGDEVSVACSFNGHTPQGNFDLIVDGILRNAVPFNNNKGTKTSRSVTFDDAFIDKTFRTTNMVVAPLDADVVTKQGEFESVGKIEVRISILRIAGQSHAVTDVSYFAEADTWKQQYPSPIGFHHLEPTSQINFVETDKPEPTKSTIKRVRGQMKGSRPGNEPWAVFKFYYRSREALRGAKLEKATGEIHALHLGLVPEGALATRREGTAATEDTTILPETVARDSSEDIKPTITRSTTSPGPTSSISSRSAEADPARHKMSDKPDHPDRASSPQPTTSATANPTLEARDNEHQRQVSTPYPSPNKRRDSKMNGTAQTTMNGEGDESDNQRKPTLKQGVGLREKDGDLTNGAVAKDNNQETSSHAVNGTKRLITGIIDGGAKRVKADFSAEEKIIAEKMKLLEERRKKRQEARERANDAEARRKAALQRQLEELQRAIDEEEQMEREAEEDRLRSEEALRAYAY